MSNDQKYWDKEVKCRVCGRLFIIHPGEKGETICGSCWEKMENEEPWDENGKHIYDDNEEPSEDEA